jgi:sugar phosphate isomerase/epimerase
LPSLGVRTLGEAMSIVERVARPEVGILVDNLHLARSGGTVDELANLGTHLFPYVQMCDASGQPVDGSRAGLLDEALHHRRLPGAGELALDAFLVAVPQVPVSFEIRSAALRAEYPDASERACAVWAAVRHFAGC